MEAEDQNQFDKIMKGLDKFYGKIGSKVDAGLIAGALLVESSAKQNVSVDTGFLKGSILHQLSGSFDEGDRSVLVGSNVAYAASLEFGMAADDEAIADPEFPDKIRAWAKRKGFGEYAESIIRRIMEKGTKPHPWLTPALAENKGNIQQIMKKAMADAVTETAS